MASQQQFAGDALQRYKPWAAGGVPGIRWL